MPSLLELTLVGDAMTVEVHGPRVYQAKSEGPQMSGTCNTDAHDLSSQVECVLILAYKNVL